MSSSTLIEVFGHIVFSFTRGVTEHYNPEEPEFTAESFGYDPFQSTGREWYYLPVDELIYQEYSDKEITSLNYPVANSLNVRVIDACSPEENEETQEQEQDRAMAWRRLRPSLPRIICKSMYIGALISLLTATVIGTIYLLISYLCCKTKLHCELHSRKSIPLQVQWMRTISNIIFEFFKYIWFFASMLSLFRPHQLMGVKRKLILISCSIYFLDVLYRVALQALGVSHSNLTSLEKLPLNVLLFISVCCQVYFLTKHLCIRSKRRQITLFLQMTGMGCFYLITVAIAVFFLFPAYSKENEEGKLLIAVFSPLIGVVLKVASRVGMQRYWNLSHPGYSYVLLAPLYFFTAVMFRVLQADLGSLQSIAILGIIHGAAEVIERSTMVVIDHIFHLICKRTSAPWGSFRTPRRERLVADIAIMSMLFESAAIVSVNGFVYLFKFIYLKENSFFPLLQSFAIYTSVQLAIEWFFTSISLAIETHYQNMAVMAVWQRRWKKHILVAVVNAVPIAIWASGTMLNVRSLFNDVIIEPCKMPFT